MAYILKVSLLHLSSTSIQSHKDILLQAIGVMALKLKNNQTRKLSILRGFKMDCPSLPQGTTQFSDLARIGGNLRNSPKIQVYPSKCIQVSHATGLWHCAPPMASRLRVLGIDWTHRPVGIGQLLAPKCPRWAIRCRWGNRTRPRPGRVVPNCKMCSSVAEISTFGKLSVLIIQWFEAIPMKPRSQECRSPVAIQLFWSSSGLKTSPSGHRRGHNRRQKCQWSRWCSTVAGIEGQRYFE